MGPLRALRPGRLGRDAEPGWPACPLTAKFTDVGKVPLLYLWGSSRTRGTKGCLPCPASRGLLDSWAGSEARDTRLKGRTQPVFGKRLEEGVLMV